MKVLYVSKALIAAAHRDKLTALSDHVDVAAVVPSRWGRRRPEPCSEAEPLIRRARVWLSGANHLHVYPDAAAILDDVTPDLVHIDEEPYSAVTWQFARLCQVRGIPSLFFAWQNIAKRLPPPFETMRRQVFRMVSGAIAGTPDALRILIELGYRGPVTAIPQFGVRLECFGPSANDRREVRDSWGVPETRFVIGYAGRLVPEKGIPTLLDAMARLPNVDLVLVGDGPERRPALGRALQLGISGRVTFLGSVPSVGIPRVLRGLDALVLPSRATRGWQEQFGRVLVEGMASGLPVVATRTGSIPWVVDDVALLVPPDAPSALADAIRTLSGDPMLRTKLAERGRELVRRRFSTEIVVQHTVDWYRVLMGEVVRQAVAT